MNNFTYSRASVVEEAFNNVNAGSAYIAGGTNLIDLMKENISKPSSLIDINHISALEQITELEDGGIRLGAAVTNANTAWHPLIAERYPLIAKAILAGASAQIRNMATNGGNLVQRTRCYYFYDTSMPCNKREPGAGCAAVQGYNRIHAILGASEHCVATHPSDLCVSLAALDAVVEVEGKDGKREIAFSDFHRLPEDQPEKDNNLLPGELITAIRLPPNRFANYNAYTKIRDRASFAFAIVSVASAFEMENNIVKKARIALGGVAHKPWRILSAEKLLEGQEINAEILGQAADLILEGAAPLRFNAFKITLARRAIIRNSLVALKLADEI